MPQVTGGKSDRFWHAGGGKIMGPSGQVVARVHVENLVEGDAWDVIDLLTQALCSKYPPQGTKKPAG